MPSAAMSVMVGPQGQLPNQKRKRLGGLQIEDYSEFPICQCRRAIDCLCVSKETRRW
jgi:hypothetical protein